jgi:regulator of RNase E activity RraA
MKPALSPSQLHALRLLDSCVVANAIETFHDRLRNEGFADGGVRCLFPELDPMVGYAATIKVRGSLPPTMGGLYSDRTDWWDYVLSLPFPRVLIVQDTATHVGLGSFLGEVHMNILKALGCVGAVTNGSVRDLPRALGMGFQLFSGGVSVSHSYVHIVEFGTPVEIAGLRIKSGDLLHGDLHGFQTVPLDHAAEIPAIATRIKNRERPIIELCHSSEFSLEKLRAAVAN